MKKFIILLMVLCTCLLSEAFIFRVTPHGFVKKRKETLIVKTIQELKFVDLDLTMPCVVNELYNNTRKHYSLKLAFSPDETNYIYIV